MADQPVSLQELRKLKSDALSNATTSFNVAQVSELLRSALLHTRCVMEKSIMLFPLHRVSSVPYSLHCLATLPVPSVN